MFDFKKIEAFEWDEGNKDKNWDKHRVSNAECEEVFFNLPLLMQHDAGHSQQEMRYFALGQTHGGRLLFLSFTVRQNKIRIISARPMSRKENI